MASSNTADPREMADMLSIMVARYLQANGSLEGARWFMGLECLEIISGVKDQTGFLVFGPEMADGTLFKIPWSVHAAITEPRAIYLTRKKHPV